jgi:hypothetical protein
VWANITINDGGIIHAASDAPPPIGGVAVSRVNQKKSITNDAKPIAPALTTLIHALGAVKTKIISYQPDKNASTQFTQSEICIRLAQKGSVQFEKQEADQRGGLPLHRMALYAKPDL